MGQNATNRNKTPAAPGRPLDPVPPSAPKAPSTARPVVLCADDFGLSGGASEAILRLAEAGRLSAVSCMTTAPAWRDVARGLDQLEGRCDIGLHLTLTDEAPAGRLPGLAPHGRFPGLRRLLLDALGRRLDPVEVTDELARQWDAFTAARGRTPDFVDGHQHVHLLPIVRDAVLHLLRRGEDGSGAEGPGPWLRICHEPPARVVARGIARGKSLFLAALSQPLRRMAAAAGIPTNDSFRGVRSFDPKVDYATLFPRFLDGHARRPLIMCHPGCVDGASGARDPIGNARRREYDYFVSDRFPADLDAAGCRLSRFAVQPSPA